MQVESDENTKTYHKLACEGVVKGYSDMMQEGGVIVKDLISKMSRPFPINLTRCTSNIQKLKYSFTLHKTSTISIVVKALMPQGMSIIGWLHGECRDANFEPRFVSLGGGLESTHGEFRRNIVTWKQFNDLWNHFQPLLKHSEQLAITKMNARELGFQADFYRPQVCHADQHLLEEFTNNNRVGIKFFAFAWMFDFNYIMTERNESKQSKRYQAILRNPTDKNTWGQVASEFDEDQLHYFQRMCNEFATKSLGQVQPWRNIAPCQKVRPVTIAEMVRANDINCELWRELYVANILSNLVINMCSPTFATLGNWFFIDNAHANMFDSDALQLQYQHSNIADQVAQQLKRANEFNFTSSKPIDEKFGKVAKQVHQAISDADKEIRLTKFSACIISEWCGRTILNAYQSSDLDIDLLIKQTFSDITHFRKHVFELLHGIRAMHQHGVIHSRIDTEKITFHTLLRTIDPTISKPRFNNPLAIFEVGAHTYIFPEDGAHMTFVGFANAILKDTLHLQKEFAPNFIDRYVSAQQSRLYVSLKHTFGDDFNEATLSKLDHDAQFDIAACMDIFATFESLSTMFKAHSKQHVPKESIELCAAIATRARELFIKQEKDVATTLIAEFFKPATTIPQGLILNIFRDNELRYDLANYAEWGPLVSLEPEFELWNKYMKTPYEDPNFNDFYTKHNESDQLNVLAAPYVEEEKDIFEPWMFE